MNHFYPTYLYIKTHNVTGLKYFGKTTKDPFKYKGSGRHWLSHIKLHGNDVTTEILGFYSSKELCKTAALKFSTDNNIVQSSQWANMIVENGLDGGKTIRTYKPMSEESKNKLSRSLKGRKPWNKNTKGLTPGNRHPKTQETKEKLRKSLKGRPRSKESIEKGRQSNRGRIVSEETKRKISESRTGYKHSEETIQKLKNKIVSKETKEKIKQARQNQIFTDETKRKLSGKVVVVDKNGILLKITKELFYSNKNQITKQYVFHNSVEGKIRKQKLIR